KVYYDIAKARDERKIADVHVVRLEQLYPFPDIELGELLAAYRPAVHLSWAQEEPRNMGAWPFLRQLDTAWGGRRVRCVARDESPSPATGSGAGHKAEQARLVEEALA